MTRTTSLILSVAAICLTATAAQAAAPCGGTIGGNKFISDDSGRTATSDRATTRTARAEDTRTTRTTKD